MSFFGDLISTVFERQYWTALVGETDKRPVSEL